MIKGLAQTPTVTGITNGEGCLEGQGRLEDSTLSGERRETMEADEDDGRVGEAIKVQRKSGIFVGLILSPSFTSFVLQGNVFFNILTVPSL